MVMGTRRFTGVGVVSRTPAESGFPFLTGSFAKSPLNHLNKEVQDESRYFFHRHRTDSYFNII